MAGASIGAAKFSVIGLKHKIKGIEPMHRRIVLASGNPGKIAELRALIAAPDVEIVTQDALGVAPAPETAATFVENALLKARHAAAQTGSAALADDSGLVVDALNGAPGVWSARYAGVVADDRANVDKLLAELHGVLPERRTARFVAVLVYLRHARDPCPLIGHGEWAGYIADAPRGTAGFGYDPVFLLPELGMTAAELAPEWKNRLSHRAKALAALHEGLRRVLATAG